MELVGLAVVLVGAIAAVGLSKSGRQTRNPAMRALLDQRGGRTLPRAVLGKPSWDIPAGGFRVHLIDMSGNAVASAQLTARYPLPSGPTYRVLPRGENQGPKKHRPLGLYRAFDNRFNVQTKDVEATRDAWSEKACQIMCEHLGNAAIKSDEETLTVLLRFPHETMPTADIGHALDLMAVLSEKDRYGEATLRAVDGGAFIAAGGFHDAPTPPSCTVSGPVTVTIEPRLFDSRAVTVASAPSRFELSEPLGLAGGQVASILPGHAQSHARACGPATLGYIGSELCIRWGEIVRSVDKLDAGVRLLQSLERAPSQGVFR